MSYVQVIGTIWMPATTAAYTYSLSPYDVENMRGDDGKIARCDIDRWLACHAVDFQSVDDFAAEIGGARYGWADEESEIIFGDCMYPEEDWEED